MDLDEIKRGLRAEIKKRENEQYFTFQCNVRQMCKDVLAKLEEQESEIAELKKERRWRKFPDEKPTEDTKVLVLVDILHKRGESIQIDTYTREDGFASTRVPRFRTYGDYVTHWMPLPMPPEEEHTDEEA